MSETDNSRCFYMIAYPEQRCPNKARWISKRCLAPVNKFVWCDEHKHSGDEIWQEESEK